MTRPRRSAYRLGLDRIDGLLEELIVAVRDAAKEDGSGSDAISEAHLSAGCQPPVNADHVMREITNRRRRSDSLPGEWFSDPAWDILLFLFYAHLDSRVMTIGDIAHFTDNRPTTTIRWLDIIEGAGLLERRRDTVDARRVFVFLNASGGAAMARYFAPAVSGSACASPLRHGGRSIDIKTG